MLQALRDYPPAVYFVLLLQQVVKIISHQFSVKTKYNNALPPKNNCFLNDNHYFSSSFSMVEKLKRKKTKQNKKTHSSVTWVFGYSQCTKNKRLLNGSDSGMLSYRITSSFSSVSFYCVKACRRRDVLL